MRIYSSIIKNQYYNQPVFKENINRNQYRAPSNSNDREVRNWLRKWHEQSCMYEDGKLSNEELKKLFNVLFRKYPPVENEKMRSIGLANLDYIGNDSYRGAMIRSSNLQDLQKLKDAGIKHIIDLEYYPDTEEECKKLGLDYLYHHISFEEEACWPTYVVNNECNNRKYYTAYKRFFEDNGRNKYLGGESRKVIDFDKHCRNTIENLIKFIQIMQKGNVYIGCEQGSGYTDCALMLDYVFNPRARHDSYIGNYSTHFLEWEHHGMVYCPINCLFDNLKKQDLQRMGWDVNGDEKKWYLLQEEFWGKIHSLYGRRKLKYSYRFGRFL